MELDCNIYYVEAEKHSDEGGISVDWREAQEDFRSVRLEKIDGGQNAHRYYQVCFQPTLLDEGAVLRMYGRKGGQQRLLITPATNLVQAWPLIRRTVQRRLQHGYQVVALDCTAPTEG